MSQIKRSPTQTIEDSFGELEAAVLRRLWDRGQATVRDVLEDLSGDRVLAYTTVMTVMSRLEGKGILQRDLVGKTYVYRPAFSERGLLQHIAAKQVRSVLDAFGDLAIAQFLSEIDQLSPERRQLLERMAAKESTEPKEPEE
jgi:predicted transcriptional regulator